MAANNKKVPPGVNVSSIQGVSWPIKYVPIHKDRVAIDIASPRILVGYISERKTNITALMEIAVKKM